MDFVCILFFFYLSIQTARILTRRGGAVQQEEITFLYKTFLLHQKAFDRGDWSGQTDRNRKDERERGRRDRLVNLCYIGPVV